MAAGVTNADFLGEGGTAGAAFAPKKTPAQLAEEERQERIRRRGLLNQTADATAAGNARAIQRAGAQMKADQANLAPGKYQSREQFEAMKKRQHGLIGNLVRDPVTMGIVLAPWAIAGGAAAGGVLGTEAAVGGGSAAAAPAITTGGAVTAPSIAAPAAAVKAPTIGSVGTVASPFAASSAAPAIAGAGAPAAAGSAFGLKEGLAAAPLALDAYGLIKSQTDSKAEKALLAKQEELAKAAAERQQATQQEGMNRIGQQLLAFNPQNQMLANIYGPGAAFSPQQMGALAADPGAKSHADYSRAHEESLRTGKPIQGFSQADIDRMYANERRQQNVTQNTQPLGSGPAPIQQRTPQAARRY